MVDCIGRMARLACVVVICVVGSLNIASASVNNRGKVLFKLCASCHGNAGEGRMDLGAPGIAGLPAWYSSKQIKSFRSGGRAYHPDDFFGLRMRPIARSLRNDKDINAVAEYLAQLTPKKQASTIKGDVTRGATLYATCIACHGPDAKGIKAMNAPTLLLSGDWYIFKQIKNFKLKLRGANPAKDPTGAMMAPMALTLPDDQAINDVISFIESKK